MWEAMSHIPTDKTVFVHCYTGQTAGQAVVTMRMAGIPAISVNSGWNLGISQVEGYEAATESTVNEIDTAYDNGASDEVIAVIRDYYQAMGEKAGTVFANNMVSEDNALKIVEAGDEGVQFVSLRRPADYDAGHIANAVNVPFGADMLDGVSSLPADKKLVAYCYSGQTANQATALLRLLGYDAVSLRFGMGTARTAPNGLGKQGFCRCSIRGLCETHRLPAYCREPFFDYYSPCLCASPSLDPFLVSFCPF
jgi:rhodanese-related sulfurtransferase